MAEMKSLTIKGKRYDSFPVDVDSTLTISGKAADAKAVGDALDELEAKIGEGGSGGAPGADGKTPVRGVDYWTETDKAEIVADVLAALPNAEGASF